MRLIHSSTFAISEFTEPAIPPYAILSHMWGAEELSLQDFQVASVKTGQGFGKIKKCCHQARMEGIEWVWIDTCCLDRSNSAELSEAINSMYKWFESAVVCYAYLSDVSSSVEEIRPTLRRCRWFTRKWTLQELVAPRSVLFFAKDWIQIGTRASLHSTISEVTGIQSAVLIGEKRPKQCHVSERMAWASNRTATRVEDEAYSMMGLFDIKMPILYGEGSRAFRRLQDEIRKTHYASVLDTARTGMRLLVTNSEPLEIRYFPASESPEYAILSHTWGSPEDEVSFSDVRQGKAEGKRAYHKVRKACELAASHGFEYLWIDTCCIDKSSSAELQEAICSMYRWYKSAQICYVYLEDCPVSSDSPSFWDNRWFTRGWTLQELIAPNFVEFYDKEWNEIGTKLSLCEHISQVTGINTAILRGSDPTKRTVAERMSWAASRSTTRIEDAAYSLMGLFNVFMPMLYGEGSRAFTRLQEQIMNQSEDYTIFAWKASFLSGNHRGLLAHSPDEFLGHENAISRYYGTHHEHEHPPTMTSRGLLIDLPLRNEVSPSEDGKKLAWLCSSKPAQDGNTLEDALLCVWLQSIPSRPGTFVRISPDRIEFLPNRDRFLFTRNPIYVLPFGTVIDDDAHDNEKIRSGMILVHTPQNFNAQLLRVLSSTGSHYPDVKWESASNELLYSCDEETCALAALVLERNEERFVVYIGFRDHLPWCSVITLGELGYSNSDQWEQSEIIQLLLSKFKWPYSDQTDRSLKRLSNGTTIKAALRIGCPTPLNPTVFNIRLQRMQDRGLSRPHAEHRVILAPFPYTKTGPTVFLSGYINSSPPTWQVTLAKSLSHLPITFLNPHRPDWDSSWRESLSFGPFVEQVDWEQDAMENADVIAICFSADTQAPITLMELGLFAKTGKCVVACPEGYWKRGNVQVICKRYGIEVLETEARLAQAVVRKLTELGKLSVGGVSE